MKNLLRFPHIVLPALVLVLLPTQVPDNGDVDPPSRVARLSYMSGPVSFRPGDVDDWADATLNYPLRGGDRLWTDVDARAEIALGSNVVRLAPQSAFGFLALDDRTTQIDLSQGAVEVRLRHLDDNEVFEIDTPNSAVSLPRPGTYRIDVDSAGDATDVTVRGGQAEVTAAGSAFSVEPGQMGIVTGTDAPSYDIASSRRSDDWEDWCSDRDRRWDESRSASYVSREVVGYEDLDQYGDWHEGSQYGAVWVPRRMETGWAPYRYGHWAWVDPWGWTWIDDAPWGFAPFHYGRWVYLDNSWAWVPGRIVARPVYAPALVAFVGGPHWTVAIGAGRGGGVAWFPLAPNEVYVPAYRTSDRYRRNVNVTNVNVTNINITNVNVTNIHYVNRDAPGAVTSVSHETFVGARPIGRNAIIVPRERLTGTVVVGSAGVAPTRVSVLARGEAEPARRPPPAAFGRALVVRSAPPPAPVSFSAREHALQSNPGHPLDQSELARLRVTVPPPPIAPVRPVLPPSGTTPALHPVREGLPAAQPLPPNAGALQAGRPAFTPRDTSIRRTPPPNAAASQAGQPGRPTFTPRDTSHRRPPVRTGTQPPPTLTPPPSNGAAMGQSRPATTVTKKPPPKPAHPSERGDTTKTKKPEHDNP